MFKNVLLPVDLNHPGSWSKSLPMARDLAGAGGRLHLLGVVHDLGMASISSFLPDDFERKALTQMKESLDAFAADHLPDARNVTVHVGHGHVPESILATAGKISADLIVMASEPPDDLRTMMVGSAATKVVRHAAIPVLVVR